MKRSSLFLCLALSVLAGCGTAEAEDSGTRQISVSGDAEIRVVPDEVIVALGVETFDPDLAAAKSESDSRLKAVIEAVKDFDIPDEHIRTEYVNIEPEYHFVDGVRHFRQYRVRRTLVITLRKIDKFERLLSTTLDVGANYVHSVEFRTTELRKYRDQARALAIRAAEEKGKAMAAELGESIGSVQRIQEGHSGWWSRYGSWWGGHGGRGMAQNVVQSVGGPSEGMDGPTMPGQIVISAQVSLTFELDD